MSDRGRLRSGNEDACGHDVGAGVFVLCDGMGGAAAGEIASHLAVETFLAAFPAHEAAVRNGHGLQAVALGDEDATPSSHSQPSAEGVADRLHDAVVAANSAVFARAQGHPELRGMGTTLVALMFEETAEGYCAWMAHAGDSRCYLLRGGQLRQLTLDHSLVEEQVRAGVLSRVQAAASPMCNVITRAVGTQSSVEAEIACHAPQPGDLYLLASDGLTRELDDAAIAQILTRAANPAMTAAASEPDDARRIVASNGPANNGCTHNGCAPQSALQAALDAACKTLVDAANAHGGRDNITVLLVAFP